MHLLSDEQRRPRLHIVTDDRFHDVFVLVLHELVALSYHRRSEPRDALVYRMVIDDGVTRQCLTQWR